MNLVKLLSQILYDTLQQLMVRDGEQKEKEKNKKEKKRNSYR